MQAGEREKLLLLKSAFDSFSTDTSIHISPSVTKWIAALKIIDHDDGDWHSPKEMQNAYFSGIDNYHSTVPITDRKKKGKKKSRERPRKWYMKPLTGFEYKTNSKQNAKIPLVKTINFKCLLYEMVIDKYSSPFTPKYSIWMLNALTAPLRQH